MKYNASLHIFVFSALFLNLLLHDITFSQQEPKKIGILFVNHGSHSATWRNALLVFEDNVRPELQKNSAIKGIKTAFMEYQTCTK